jgi:hypothetical protein
MGSYVFVGSGGCQVISNRHQSAAAATLAAVDSSSSFVAPLAAPTGVGGRVCVNDERLSHLRSVGVTFSTLAFSTVSLDECSSAAT